uniref:Uncharacterized protein n=1 Tax=Rhizophora mucronata TaxID=61149 RepID=A0A2P2N871_RHIMU
MFFLKGLEGIEDTTGRRNAVVTLFCLSRKNHLLLGIPLK